VSGRISARGVAAGVALMAATALPATPVSAVAIGANRPPGPPTLLTPTDGEVVGQPTAEVFSLSAVDPDGDPFTGRVSVFDSANNLVSTFVTSPSSSGGVSAGTPATPLHQGAYTWEAVAIDEWGASSPPAAAAFTVAPTPTTGAGVAAGTAAYPAPGVFIAGCAASSSYSLQAALLAVNLSMVGYAGPVAITGTASGCDSLTEGSGTVALSVNDLGLVDSTIACTVSGPYTRVASALVLDLSGSCTIDDFPAESVALTAGLSFAPASQPRDSTGGFETAALTGPVVVRPQELAAAGGGS